MSAMGWKKAGSGARPFRFAAALFVGALLSTQAFARPAILDRSLDRDSDHGLFHLQIQSSTRPIPLWRVHQWIARVTDASGRPASGAMVAVDGGMPEHRHGLPATPRAAPAEAPADYLINGVKFSMLGWWVLKFNVQSADGRADTITFNLVL